MRKPSGPKAGTDDATSVDDTGINGVERKTTGS